MSRARGMRGARKMRGFVKDRVVSIASEDEWEQQLLRSGDRLLVIEFAAVRRRRTRARGAQSRFQRWQR